MKVINLAAVVAFFAATCEAVPTPHPYSVHEKREIAVPHVWKRGSRVQKDATLPFRIGLTQNNLDNGEDYLMDVSNPLSPNFGKHWTMETIHDTFAPSQHTVDSVRAWLISHGILGNSIAQSDNKGWLAFEMTAQQAEDIFQAEYYEYVHVEDGKVRVGCDEYGLPEHLREHVDFMTPGIKLSPVLARTEVKRSDRPAGKHTRRPMKHAPFNGDWSPPKGWNLLPPNLQNCGVNITLDCIKALYLVPDAWSSDSVNKMAVYEDDDFYAQEDLNLFFAKFAPHIPQGTHPILKSVDGGQAPVAPSNPLNGGESDIDLDLAFGLIYPQSVILYQVDDSIEDQTDAQFNVFLDALDGSYCNYTAFGITGDSPGLDPVYPDPAPGGYKGKLMCGTYKPTRVISISYGAAEYDAPPNYTRRQCNEFLKLGLAGTTIIFASGDYGVAAPPGDDSQNGCLGPDFTVYNPSFPTCPWLLDVGATRLYADQTILDQESALQADLGGYATLFASAGGFANYFPVPQYQQWAIQEYFQNYDPNLPYYVANYNATNIGANGGIYNRAGRGIPDVAANGANLLIFNDEIEEPFYGTSLAAPIWGGIVTLINEERTAIGKGPVGFINPTLYQNPWTLNDIVNGSNPGCGSQGFSAVPGWDPVTGLGTPNFPHLTGLFLALP